ncbi:hypothetical protein E3Q03_00575 [Wallemia mellicola]|uniref:CCD97-like C-terminal domain-containing protein n=3 Tax=Wallemia mellicola TaxID=1708541 RepID=A0AB74KLT4_9BASI|nr:hypothetical protein E3Q21_00494 [Wallemia mellicola]TIC71563.1 hypothetical protein E3Q03_00575 [Wallemia mellicola]
MNSAQATTSNPVSFNFDAGSSTPPKPKAARQRIQRPTQPASLDSGCRYRYRPTSRTKLRSDGDLNSMGMSGYNHRNNSSSSPSSAGRFSHAILSSSPLAPQDAADPKKRLWKERFKSQQLRKIARAKDVDSTRMNSKQLFNLDEVDDEEDDFLGDRIMDKMTESDYNKFLRREERKYDIHVGSDYDPLEFWSDAGEDIPEDLEEMVEIPSEEDDFDDLFNDAELDALYDDYLAKNTQNTSNREDTSMDMS